MGSRCGINRTAASIFSHWGHLANFSDLTSRMKRGVKWGVKVVGLLKAQDEIHQSPGWFDKLRHIEHDDTGGNRYTGRVFLT